MDRLADRHCYLTGQGKVSVSSLEFPQTINPYGHHSRIEFADQQPCAGHERIHCSVPGALPFGENHQVVTAIHHLAGKAEATTKTTLLGHRKHIEEKYHQDVLEQMEQPREQSCSLWRMQPFAQEFAVLGDHHLWLESCRQRK